MPFQSLTIFFPMYNEAESIEGVIAHAEQTIPKLGFADFEILIIDDGSQDGCDRLVEQASARNPAVRLVRHPRNLGYGAALRTGFQAAAKELVFYTDCDLPTDLSEIARALPLLETADLVVGYRLKRYEHTRRIIYTRIYNTLMRLMFAVKVRDSNCSFKLVRRSALERIHLTASSAFIDGQLLAEAVRWKFSIVEIPVEYRAREYGKSSFDSLHAAWVTLLEMLQYWTRRRGVPPAG
jgi:glycosyltransferase involved in cell wall biosynthesis